MYGIRALNSCWAFLWFRAVPTPPSDRISARIEADVGG
jgi:hypothetical protein